MAALAPPPPHPHPYLSLHTGTRARKQLPQHVQMLSGRGGFLLQIRKLSQMNDKFLFGQATVFDHIFVFLSPPQRDPSA